MQWLLCSKASSRKVSSILKTIKSNTTPIFRFQIFLAYSCLALCANLALAQSSFIAFESGPVRPVALSIDGNTLFITNIPDNRLELVDVSSDSLISLGSVPVGLEPVAIAVLDADTLFVANHLSDSVSVVKLTPRPHVSMTLLVGDEPRDLVIADPDGAGPLAPRLFIATAHRGQHRDHASIAGVPGAGSSQLTQASIPRADVWVFDTGDLGQAVGGVPLQIVELFADTPRALAVSNDGTTVYVAIHFSGNQTTIVNTGVVCNGFTLATSCTTDGISTPGGLLDGMNPGGNPGPSTNVEGIDAPEVGLIVKWNPDAGPADSDVTTGEFQDELARNWNNAVRFRLPDKDVFAIDTTSLQETAVHTGVGTTLFNMVVNPVSGALYISNTDANNAQRFEGPGIFGGSTVQGHLAKSQITVISQPEVTGSDVDARHLNKHIDYSLLPASEDVRDRSLATPLEMVVSPDGNTLYVAGFGSSAIGYFDTNELEQNTFTPNAEARIDVSGGGPAGLAINQDGSRLYALTRFDNGVSAIDTLSKTEVSHITLYNPEPSSIIIGREFLYDARTTSSNGETSCASCHIFGDTDHLAWDLGDPDDVVKFDPIPTLLGQFANIGSGSNGGADVEEFHPMKGPMTTQTLRGLSNSGAMHWRGDRSNGALGMDATDEDLSFRNFIVAFSGLVGREENIDEVSMQAFSDFQLQVFLPPNPNRMLDNSLRSAEQRGADFFDGPRLSDGLPNNSTSENLLDRTGFTCEGCHELDRAQGFFGTGTNQSFEGGSQIIKVPHLRNLYTKIGMFGMPQSPGITTTDNSFLGDQIRGYGFTHDGSIDSLLRFLSLSLFQSGVLSDDVGFTDSSQHHDMEEFLLVFDTDLAPIVGQQVTYSAVNEDFAADRVALLMQRASTSFVSKSLGGVVVEADLIAKATVDGIARGWFYQGGNSFISDQNEVYSLDELQCLSQTDGPVTFTAVPPGSGSRIGIDRDEDSVLDGLEVEYFGLTRVDTTPADVDTLSDRYLSCLALKQQRTAQSTQFDCDTGALTFAVSLEGSEIYQISMQLSNSDPVQFELTDGQGSSSVVDNMPSYSVADGLLLPVTRISCENVVSNLRLQLLQEDPIIFEVVSFDQ